MLFIGSIATAFLAATASAPAAAWGEGACDLLLGTAASQAAPLVAPTLFVDTGFVNGGESPFGQPDLPPGPAVPGARVAQPRRGGLPSRAGAGGAGGGARGGRRARGGARTGGPGPGGRG